MQVWAANKMVGGGGGGALGEERRFCQCTGKYLTQVKVQIILCMCVYVCEANTVCPVYILPCTLCFVLSGQALSHWVLVLCNPPCAIHLVNNWLFPMACTNTTTTFCFCKMYVNVNVP